MNSKRRAEKGGKNTRGVVGHMCDFLIPERELDRGVFPVPTHALIEFLSLHGGRFQCRGSDGEAIVKSERRNTRKIYRPTFA